jgi:predicted amidophosphoribosyltransferase
VALFEYAGVGAELVRALKFSNHRDAVRPVGQAMAALVGPAIPEAVTWVPASSERRRRNGFDHARLLAKVVAAELGVPVRGLLRRVDRVDVHQTGRGRLARLDGPPLAAASASSRGVRAVLLVDDVRTTGASLSTAAGVLRRAGVTDVGAVTLAATPSPRDPRSSTIRSISEPPKGDRLCRSE